MSHSYWQRGARIAVGASTVRGQGNRGVVASARTFLRTVDLRSFGTDRAPVFAAVLDRTTQDLRDALPATAQHWGIARKVLNIFLRDCLYTSYLSERYGLKAAEFLFELPLDSITARELRKAAGRGRLPPWPGVKGVDSACNRAYQAVALHVAGVRKMARVHLDALWWAVGRDDAV